METIVRDLRLALRQLRQRPLLTLIAAASIAIGMGATTIIASVMDGLLFRPPAGVVAPERVVEVGRSTGSHQRADQPFRSRWCRTVGEQGRCASDTALEHA